MCVRAVMFFFFKQKTAYDMRISDWSSDVCSSDLIAGKTTAQTTNQRSIADGGVEIWSKAAREDCPESEAGSAGSLGERNAGEKRIGNGVSIEKSRCPCRPAIVSKGVEFRRIAEIDACIYK